MGWNQADFDFELTNEEAFGLWDDCWRAPYFNCEVVEDETETETEIEDELCSIYDMKVA